MNRLLSVALVTLLTLLSNSSKAQQNILHLWVDTVIVEPGQSDVFLEVKYWLEVHKQPTDFSGYSARIVYQHSNVNVISVHLESTASRNFPDPIVNTTMPGEVRVAALGATVDTNYPALFRLRVNVSPGLSAGEQAQFMWAEMQLSDFSGIDSVSLGQGMIMRRKPIEPPTPDSILVDIPGDTVLDTTSFALPVHFNEISGSNVKHLVLSFDYDSSVIRFDSATLVSGVTGVTVEEVIQPTHADVFLQSIDTNRITGDGEMFMLHFTSVLRPDTVCTMLQSATIQVLNDGSKVDYKNITLSDICVNGTFVPDDTASAAVPEKQVKLVRVSPNPLQESTTFSVDGYEGMFTVRIFDLTGCEVYNGSHFSSAEWRPEGLVAGVYYARIEYGRTIEVLKLVLM